MVFKSFYWRLGFRLGLLVLSIFVFAFCVISELYLRSVYLAVFSLILTCELFYFLTRFTNNIKTFLMGIQQREFSAHFDEKNDPLRALYQEMNSVMSAFKQLTEAREVQHRFLEMVIEHIRVGILCIDEAGKIYLINNAFRVLVGKRLYQKLTLDTLPSGFVDKIVKLKSGEGKSIDYSDEVSTKVFSVYASSFRLKRTEYKLISVQDITSELNVKEQESYLKLMRVLTHEIMNSMAPIVSLSDTLYRMAEKTSKNSIDENVVKSLATGLDAIRIRSKNLHQFTEAYRQLARIPNPALEKTDIRIVLENVLRLLEPDLNRGRIKTQQQIASREIYLDKNLMEQAFLNLLKNAVEAVSEPQAAVITVAGTPLNHGYQIEITDNGSGISTEDVDRIFVPFFTTKKNGTGIGLAIVRQIIQLHRGEITVASVPNERTTFTILLP